MTFQKHNSVPVTNPQNSSSSSLDVLLGNTFHAIFQYSEQQMKLMNAMQWNFRFPL